MTITVGARREVVHQLVRAQQRFDAANRTARRSDVQQGDFDNAYEGAVSGINFLVEAYLLASSGTRRKVGEDEATTLIHVTCSGLTARHIPCPDAMDLIWEQRRRNTSAHEGDWVSNLGPDDLERVASLGERLLHAVRTYAESA